MSLRVASVRASRKQIRVPTLSDVKGREIAALETVTARFTKVRLRVDIPSRGMISPTSPLPHFFPSRKVGGGISETGARPTGGGGRGGPLETSERTNRSFPE